MEGFLLDACEFLGRLLAWWFVFAGIAILAVIGFIASEFYSWIARTIPGS